MTLFKQLITQFIHST